LADAATEGKYRLLIRKEKSRLTSPQQSPYKDTFSATVLSLFVLQYSPKIMHAQELLFASASRQLLAATCA